MRKKILLMLSVLMFAGIGAFAQSIEGGAGVVHVDGDPNSIATLNNMDITEAHVALDTTGMVVYFFDGSQAAGAQWIAVDISNLTDPVTSVDTDVASPEITVDQTTGDVTISFESSATLSWNAATDELTFTDTDGVAETALDLSDLATIVQATAQPITVSGTGVSGDPYEISLTGAATAGAGTVPVNDGSGSISWSQVVEDIEILADGSVQVTMSDGTTTATLDFDNAPKVANFGQLDAAADALPVGTSGIAVAAPINTFGMPANSDFGVIFFIKGK